MTRRYSSMILIVCKDSYYLMTIRLSYILLYVFLKTTCSFKFDSNKVAIQQTIQQTIQTSDDYWLPVRVRWPGRI